MATTTANPLPDKGPESQRGALIQSSEDQSRDSYAPQMPKSVQPQPEKSGCMAMSAMGV